MFHCEKSSTPFDGIKQSGKLLNLSEFSRDRQVYDKLMSMIDAEITENGNEVAKATLKEETETRIACRSNAAAGRSCQDCSGF